MVTEIVFVPSRRLPCGYLWLFGEAVMWPVVKASCVRARQPTAMKHFVLLGLSYQVAYYALCGESLGTWRALACSCIQPCFVWGEPGDVASSGT